MQIHMLRIIRNNLRKQNHKGQYKYMVGSEDAWGGRVWWGKMETTVLEQ